MQKIDIIQLAYSELRISGITVKASPESIATALQRMELMASEFAGRNVCVDYNFEDEASPDDELGCDQVFHHMMGANLAVRLIPDFNKTEVPTTLSAQATQSFRAASGVVAREKIQEVAYPARMPRGSGSRWFNRWRRFYPPTYPPKTSCGNVQMYEGDVRDMFSEFKAYLGTETIVSHSIEVTSGITVVSDGVVDSRVLYRIEAVGRNTGFNDNVIQIKIETSTGRKTTRIRYVRIRPLALEA